MSKPVPWLPRARAHLGRVSSPSTAHDVEWYGHPADAAFALAVMLSDLAELRLEVERALGLAMLDHDDPGGRPKPDEVEPERREVRAGLGMDRTYLAALAWLAREPESMLTVVRERVRAAPFKVWTARSLQKEFGG
jgi:hypothetical protein